MLGAAVRAEPPLPLPASCSTLGEPRRAVRHCRSGTPTATPTDTATTARPPRRCSTVATPTTAPSTVSHELLNSKHKSSSLADIARTAAFGQTQPRRAAARIPARTRRQGGSAAEARDPRFATSEAQHGVHWGVAGVDQPGVPRSYECGSRNAGRGRPIRRTANFDCRSATVPQLGPALRGWQGPSRPRCGPSSATEAGRCAGLGVAPLAAPLLGNAGVPRGTLGFAPHGLSRPRIRARLSAAS